MESIDSLLNYLEKNQKEKLNHDEMYRRHKKLVEDISSNLENLKIKYPEKVYKEVFYTYHDKVGIISLAVVSRNLIFLIKAKTTTQKSVSRTKEKGINQLREAHSYFLENFGISCNLIFVYRSKGKKIHYELLKKPIQYLKIERFH
jgi:hypothetical protein